MSFLQKLTVPMVTNSSGESTGLTPDGVTGFLHAIQYTPGSSAFSTAAGLTVSVVESGEVLFKMSPFNSTVDTWFAPRTNIYSTAGSTVAGNDRFALALDQLQFVLSSGGSGKTGTFRVFVD